MTGRQDYFDEKDNCLKQCWDSKKKKSSEGMAGKKWGEAQKLTFKEELDEY